MEGFARGLELIGTGVGVIFALVCVIFGLCWVWSALGDALEPLLTSKRARQDAWTATKCLATVVFWVFIVLGVLMMIGMLVELLVGAPVVDAITAVGKASHG